MKSNFGQFRESLYKKRASERRKITTEGTDSTTSGNLIHKLALIQLKLRLQKPASQLDLGSLLMAAGIPTEKNKSLHPNRMKKTLNRLKLLPLRRKLHHLSKPLLKKNRVNQLSLILNQPSLNLDQPRLTLDQPSLILDQPRLTLDQPSLILDQPSLILDQPSLTLDQPSLTLNQPSLILRQLTKDLFLLRNLSLRLKDPNKLSQLIRSVLMKLSMQRRSKKHLPKESL